MEARASLLTSSENLSAPVANDSKAKLVVLAATVPKAAAIFKPDAKAARATSSATLIASVEGSSGPAIELGEGWLFRALGLRPLCVCLAIHVERLVLGDFYLR